MQLQKTAKLVYLEAGFEELQKILACGELLSQAEVDAGIEVALEMHVCCALESPLGGVEYSLRHLPAFVIKDA